MTESLQLIMHNGRFRGKNGEGKISTEAIALILARPGEPIFCETTQNNGNTHYRKKRINLQQNT
jgi:hypothetical protein